MLCLRMSFGVVIEDALEAHGLTMVGVAMVAVHLTSFSPATPCCAAAAVAAGELTALQYVLHAQVCVYIPCVCVCCACVCVFTVAGAGSSHRTQRAANAFSWCACH